MESRSGDQDATRNDEERARLDRIRRALAALKRPPGKPAYEGMR